jgi:hypothetical protein
MAPGTGNLDVPSAGITITVLVTSTLVVGSAYGATQKTIHAGRNATGILNVDPDGDFTRQIADDPPPERSVPITLDLDEVVAYELFTRGIKPKITRRRDGEAKVLWPPRCRYGRARRRDQNPSRNCRCRAVPIPE